MDNDGTTPAPKRPKLVLSPSAPDVTAVGTTTMSTSTTTNLWDLLDNPLLRNITSFLPNDELMKVSLVSQRTNASIPRATAAYESRAPGTIVTVLQLSPCQGRRRSERLRRRRRGRLNQLVHQLELRSRNTPNVLERYQHVSVMDWYKFDFHILPEKRLRPGSRAPTPLYYREEEFITEGPRIEGITSLDFCFSTPINASHSLGDYRVFEKFAYLLPSLREITFGNMYFCASYVASFFENCSRLEKFTYYNNNQIIEPRQGSAHDFISLDGINMRAGKNLRELYLDNTNFVINNYEFYYMADLESDDERVSKTFLFHECSSTVLERISIRKAGVWVTTFSDDRFYRLDDDMVIPIPQAALIKFIRNAPLTMRWFRSNLTRENIQMLQQERPKIEFVQ